MLKHFRLKICVLTCAWAPLSSATSFESNREAVHALVDPSHAPRLEKLCSGVINAQGLRCFHEPSVLGPDLSLSIGYRAGSQFVAYPFYLNPLTKKVFSDFLYEVQATSRLMPRSFPEPLKEISNRLRNYIRDYRERVYPKNPGLSGLTFDQAAEKITRAGFCFQIDPVVVVAKLQQETKFDRTARGVNGTGMSQLVHGGIQEVFDQLGGNMNQSAPQENIAFFNRAADCFVGERNSLQRILWNRLPPNVRTKKTLDFRDTNEIKKLILNDFDLDLIFGHIVLKVNLIRFTRATEMTQSQVRQVYHRGLVSYNGSSIKEFYGRSVLSIYDEISESQFGIPRPDRSSKKGNQRAR